MLALQRQREILRLIEQEGAVRVANLARRFKVTEETIRRDLTTLENTGRVTRSHGGAVLSLSSRLEVPHQQREVLNKAEKIRIANEAVQRVSRGDALLLDASSSALFLAQQLPDMPLTVLTNSVAVVNTLADYKRIKLIGVGGTFAPMTMSFVGPSALNSLKEYHVDKLFFSCRGLDVGRGLSDSSEATAQVKQQMLQIADQRILLADHSKFGVRALAVIADLSAITELITDDRADAQQCEIIQKLGVPVTQTQTVAPDPLPDAAPDYANT